MMSVKMYKLMKKSIWKHNLEWLENKLARKQAQLFLQERGKS